MRARVQTVDLVEGLAAVKPAVGAERPVVLIEMTDTGLRLAADDLSVGISTTIPVAPEFEGDDGRVMVPHRPMAEFVAKTDGAEIQLLTEDGTLVVGDGPARMTLATIDSDWFPHRDIAESDLRAVLDGDQWSRVRGLAAFASTEDSAGPLTCVSFSADGAAATDKYQLAGFDHAFAFEALVPAQIIRAVSDDVAEVVLESDGRTIRLTAEHVSVTTSCVGGNYPSAWRKNLVKKGEGTLTLPTRPLVKALDRAQILSRKDAYRGRVVRFLATGDELAISSEPDLGGADRVSGVVEPIDGEKHNVDYDFAINAGYLRALTEVLGKPEEVTLQMNGPGKPLVATEGDSMALVTLVHLPGANRDGG